MMSTVQILCVSPGYGRIILALISFYYMPDDYVVASSCYLLSGLLDAFDGYAARKLNQVCQYEYKNGMRPCAVTNIVF